MLAENNLNLSRRGLILLDFAIRIVVNRWTARVD
jgi:hypothetical protein